MAESVVVKNVRDGLLDWIVGANSYRFVYKDGTLNLNVPGPSVANYLNDGKFAADGSLHGQPSLRYDQDQPMSGSFTAYLRDISDASYITAPQLILKSGLYAASWGTSMGANGEVITGDLKWTIKGTTHGDAADHTILCKWVTLTGAIAAGSPNMVTLNFTAFDLYPTVT